MPDIQTERRGEGQSFGFVLLTDGSQPIIQPRTRTKEMSDARPNRVIDRSIPPSQEMQTVSVAGDQPQLEELLRRNSVLMAVLEGGERSQSPLLTARHLRLWFCLVVLALVWGAFVALSFTANDFFLVPAAAVLGALCTLGLAGTLVRLGRGKL